MTADEPGDPTSAIQVDVFAGIRAAIGQTRIAVQVPADRKTLTIAELRARLCNDYPHASSLIARSMFAINNQYVQDDHQTPPGTVVLCIPPVSGG